MTLHVERCNELKVDILEGRVTCVIVTLENVDEGCVDEGPWLGDLWLSSEGHCYQCGIKCQLLGMSRLSTWLDMNNSSELQNMIQNVNGVRRHMPITTIVNEFLQDIRQEFPDIPYHDLIVVQFDNPVWSECD